MKQTYRNVVIAASGALVAAVAANMLRNRSAAGRMMAQTMTVMLDREAIVDALAEADRAVAAFERAPIERRNPGCEVEVDGGIDATTAPLVVRAGATALVAGSAIFGEKDRGAALERLRGELKRATMNA